MMNTLQIIKLPSALAPITMSLMAIAIVLVHFALYGIVHEEDEGTAAHIFHLLMVVQIPMVIFFLIKWGRESLRLIAPVVAIQITLWLLAWVAVFYIT